MVGKVWAVVMGGLGGGFLGCARNDGFVVGMERATARTSNSNNGRKQVRSLRSEWKFKKQEKGKGKSRFPVGMERLEVQVQQPIQRSFALG